MLHLTCLCGQVRLDLAKRPDYINECNCTLCAKSGAQWGYFHPSEVSMDGETVAFRRADKADPNAEAHFCGRCGATTHFVLTETAIARFGNTMMGVNMRLADQRDLAGVELRYPDGRSWSGAGDFAYVREHHIISTA